MMSSSTAAACPRCESPVEASDLRCAVCALPLAVATSATTTQATILRCDGCGAALTYDVEVKAPRCAFCGSIAHLETSEDPIERAQAYLPFSVTEDRAHAALRHWLGKLGFFRPGDLQTEATVQQLKPTWWVGWTFDVEAFVSWTADSDAGSRRSSWAPHAGQSPVRMESVLVSASRGLTAPETASLARSYDLGTAQAAPQPMPNAVIEQFDVQRSAARRIVSDAVESHAKGIASHWIPGSRFRNLHVAVLPRRLTTRRLGFPAYVLAYRYRDRLYRAIVHGQNPECVIGTAPWSWLRIALVALGGTALVALLIGLLARLMSR